MKVFIVILAAILCSACAVRPDSALEPTAQALIQSPAPMGTLGFVNAIDPPPGIPLQSDEEICIVFYDGAVLLAGGTAADQARLSKDTQFLINNGSFPINVFVRQRIPKVDVYILNGTLTRFVQSCFSVQLAAGTHLFSVAFMTSDGTVLHYEWAYEVQ